MKARTLICATVLAVLSASIINQALAQDRQSQEKEEKQMAGPQEMMKAWMEASTPGESHRFLDRFAGKWETSTRVWWGGPAQPPSESKGSAETKWIMDGRFLLEEQNGQVMGQPHKSMGITGYDNYKKKYVTSFIGSMQTNMYISEGTLDQSGKVLTYHGKMDEPMTGERDKLFRSVVRIISKDKYVWEVYDLVGTPEEFKAVEITYTRKP
ncbi:MAG: DUF1579 domain-containing protein [Blastocatellia bacterium]|nr:DUF1579 domain-containing protein [Blastocatellia bacterium]